MSHKVTFLEGSDPPVDYDARSLRRMRPNLSIPPGENTEELAELIATLFETGRKLERLTGGEVDSVADSSGSSFLLARAQEHLRNADISNRSAMDTALRATEERMRFALQHAYVGIWDLDYTTGNLKWSDVMEAQYGLALGSFGGTFDAFVDKIHPDDRTMALQVVHDAVATGSEFNLIHRTIWPDGSVRWLSGTGRILLDEGGKPSRAIGISQDVTDRHLLEGQFQQAQKMEAMGRLAGGIAHDFNNLLTVILGFSELLLSRVDAREPENFEIGQIQKAGMRAAELTRQLLAFSRNQIIELTLLDLNALLTDLQPMLGRLIRENVKVIFVQGPGLSRIKADRGQIEQAILNLAVNAQDAMPGGGTLNFSTANIDLDQEYATTHFNVSPGPYVALTVSDSGTGMTEEVRARVFEPFFTTKDVGKGTGLGLASVHGTISRCGGSISLRSELGEGTSFTIFLPRAAGSEVTVAVPQAVAGPGRGTETLLVVEDSDGLRELTQLLLEKQGYTVLLASNAAEALKLFVAHPTIALLLTDMVMPGGSGADLAIELTRLRPGLKVIYMSGYTDDAIVQHGVLNSGIAFLQKPFTSVALGCKIREALDRNGQHEV